MFNPKISIIIPVYNTELYLSRCLESCINQTMEEIEIIVINDASPDKSYLIMENYEQTYSDKVRCIYLKENIRQGGARNVGLHIARGEYVLFVDSDDWILPDMCQSLYDKAILEQADIVYCNVLREGLKEDLISNRFPDDLLGITDNNIGGIISQKYVGPWAHLVKRKLIINNELYFPEKVIGEDTAITKLWDICANKIEKVNEAFYYYCLNMNSTGQAEIRKYYNDYYQCIRLLYDNLLGCVKTEKYLEECRMICLEHLLNYTGVVCKKCEIENIKEQVEKDFRDNFNYIYSDCENILLWKYWFTPKEIDFLQGKINLQQYLEGRDGDISDYRLYYENIRKEVMEVIKFLAEKGKTKIAVWSKTAYSKGFQETFSNIKIIDVTSLMDEEFDCVIALRSLHIENARHELNGRNIILFDMEGVLKRKNKFERFCYKC